MEGNRKERGGNSGGRGADGRRRRQNRAAQKVKPAGGCGAHTRPTPLLLLSLLYPQIFFSVPLSLSISPPFSLLAWLLFCLFLFLLEGFARRFGWICRGPTRRCPLGTRRELPSFLLFVLVACLFLRRPRRRRHRRRLWVGRTGVGRTDGAARARTAGRWTKNGVRGRWAIRWTYPSTPLLLSPSPGAKESLSSWSPEMPLSVPCYLCHFCFALS
jgi:hypothetical protein